MSTRDRIVAAAARVMREKGIARSTTREIARAAGCSEGLLYKHFASKEDLFLVVLAEELPSLITLLADLPARAGQGSVLATLEEIAATALAFYAETVPIAGSILADPALLASHARAVRAQGAGPDIPNVALANYLRAEQRSGRVRADVDPAAAAVMFFGACLQRVFLRLFDAAARDPAGDMRFAADLARAVWLGLAPDPA